MILKCIIRFRRIGEGQGRMTGGKLEKENGVIVR